MMVKFIKGFGHPSSHFSVCLRWFWLGI